MSMYVVSSRDVGRDNNFNLIRMIAASGVLFSHAFTISLGAAANEPFTGIFQGKSLGSVCVLIFFAVSGFFIAKSFDRRHSLFAFAKARVLRIFPGLAVVLLLTILVMGLFVTQAPAERFWSAAPSYFYRNMGLFSLRYGLPGVFVDHPVPSGINGSLWTLSYEVLCYLGVVICGLLGLFQRRGLFALGLVAFVLFYGVTMFVDVHPRISTLAYLALPFAAGMSFYVWRDHILMSGWIGLGLAAISTLLHSTEFFIPAMSVTVAYLTFLAGFVRNNWLLRYNKFGDYSYGMYIYAFPIQQMAVWFGITVPWMNMAFAFPLALVFAVLSWHLVEKPALSLARKDRGSLAAKATASQPMQAGQ